STWFFRAWIFWAVGLGGGLDLAATAGLPITTSATSVKQRPTTRATRATEATLPTGTCGFPPAAHAGGKPAPPDGGPKRAERALVGGARGGRVPLPLRKSDVEEAGDGNGRAEGADDHADDDQGDAGADDLVGAHRELVEELDVTHRVLGEVAHQEHDAEGAEGADHALHEALEHERDADEPV